MGSERFLPRLQIMFDGYLKVDPPNMQEAPHASGCPRIFGQTSLPILEDQMPMGHSQSKVAFYYLLRVGEYTVIGSRNNAKQTFQFKYEDVSFFQKIPIANSIAFPVIILTTLLQLRMGPP